MYVGKLLRVNLSTGKLEQEDLNLEIATKFIGGRGYGAKLLWEELRPRIDPFSKGNKIIFLTGPLTGIAPASGRCAVVSKSPLTGTIFDSNVGGDFGVKLKKSGFDGIVIEGASRNPVYLVVKNGKAQLKNAMSLWGKNIKQVTSALAGKGKSIACIGRAGENLVRYACISIDAHRHAGRGGLGAVLGAKKLKAIVVSGDKELNPLNPHAFANYRKKFLEMLNTNPITGDGLGRYGTLILMNLVNKAGILPVKNFQESFSKVESISGESMRKYLLRRKGCALCPIGCGRISRIKGIETSLEYESTWALGPNLAIRNPKVIAQANELCNSYGLDTISMGNTLGFAMEASEKGLLKEKLKWGDAETVLKSIAQTAERKGIGDLLAEGTKRVAEKIGGKRFAAQVKGLELPAYDPRGAKGQALAYATSNRGGCHLRAYLIAQEILSLPRYLDNLTYKDKARMVSDVEEIFAVLDSLILCKFTSFAVFSTFKFECDLYAKMLTTATGMYFGQHELKLAGERIWNLERCFNLREGFTCAHDVLPKKFEKPIPAGPARGETINLSSMLGEYYKLRGWNRKGVPTEKKLGSLGLEPFVAFPKLQVALDLRDLEEGIKLAVEAVKGGVDWLEIGTPLIKSEGMHAVRRFREEFPNKIIVADMKTLDTGFLEVELAAQAGADVVGIAGIATNHTIKDAVGASKKYDIRVMADLIAVPDPLRRARELEKLGVDYVEFHTSVDEQLRAGDKKISFPTLRKIANILKIPVAVAGGLRVENVKYALKAGAKILIVGSAITRTANSKEATRTFLKEMGR